MCIIFLYTEFFFSFISKCYFGKFMRYFYIQFCFFVVSISLCYHSNCDLIKFIGMCVCFSIFWRRFYKIGVCSSENVWSSPVNHLALEISFKECFNYKLNYFNCYRMILMIYFILVQCQQCFIFKELVYFSKLESKDVNSIQEPNGVYNSYQFNG